MSANKTTAERIAEQRARMEQMENELKKLQRRQKEEDRKARTHRICQRGGLIESLLPDTIALSDEHFKAFLVKTVANDFGRRTLAAFKAEQEKGTAESGIGATADGGTTPTLIADTITSRSGESNAAKPTQPPQGGGAASAARAPEAIRQGA